MAVEIPVFIDIDKAFAEAAANVKTAMKPLQAAIDSAPASLFIDVKVGKAKKVLIELFDDAKTSTAQFQTALDQVNAKIDKLATKGKFNFFDGKGGLRSLGAEEKNLLEAATMLETKLYGVGNASNTMGRVLTMNMKSAEAEMAKYQSQLDKLTAKQNLAGKKTGGTDPRVATSAFQKQIDAVNLKIQQTRSFLAACSMEMERMTGKAGNVGVAVDYTNKQAMEMAASFRRGHEYIQRWNAGLAASGSHLGALIKSSVTLIGLHSATRFIQNVRNVTAEFEMQRVALGGIIQDTERAEKLFKQIKAAAIQSPFEIKDLVSFTKQLSAYRIETENLFEVTMRLADISAGLGVDMSRLVLAYGQVRAAAVLRGQELRQFTEAGIPLVDLLAEKFTKLNGRIVKTAEVFDLISKRAVPFSMIKEIFEDMTNAGGIFYKMQEKQSETLKGQWMKLKDAASIMYDEIGNTEGVHNAMTDLLAVSMRLMQNWRDVGKVLTGVVAAIVAYRIVVANARIAANALTAAEIKEISALELNTVSRSKLIAAIFGENAATKLSIVLGNAYVAVKTKEMMATNLFTKALYRMLAALLKNPYALAAAAIVGLIYAIIKLTKKTDDSRISIDKFQKSLESFNKANSHADDIDKLCDKYDQLAKKTDRTKEETDELVRVTKELGRAYPQAITGTNLQTGALDLNTAAIRENNKEAREAIRLALERDKHKAETSLSDLVEERNKIIAQLQSGTKFQWVQTSSGGYGASGEFREVGLTDEDRARLGDRLIELNQQIGEFQDAVTDADKALQGLTDDLIGPPLPDFFGDAWRSQLNSYTTTLKSTGTTIKALTKDQIEGFGDQQEALKAIAKEYEAQTALVTFYTSALQAATGERKKQTQESLDDALLMQAMYKKILDDFNAFSLVKDKGNKGYTQDPFIKQMQDRMKFMQDFKKGYDSLSKYMSKAGALTQEASTMLTRGLSMGIDPAQQKRAAEDLSKWYEDAMAEVFKQAQKKGAGNDMTAFLSKQITGNSNKAKALRDFQQLLQSLWDAKTDFDTTQMTKNFDNAFKKMKDELKRSEEMRNFFNDLLDITGDNELSANLTFGIYGGEQITGVKEAIQQQLSEAFASLSADSKVNLSEDMKKAFDEMDFNYILSNMEAAKIPEEWQKILREMAQDARKYSGQIIKDFTKLVEKYGDTSQKIAVIEAKAAKEIKEVEDALAESMKNVKLTPKQKKALQEQAAAIIKALEGQRELDKFKAGEEYVRFFAEINTMTLEEATLARTQLRQAFIAAFQAGSISADELRRNLRAVDEQFKKLNEDSSLLMAYMTGGIDGLSKRVTDYADTIQVLAGKVSKGQPLSQSETNWMNSMIKMFGKSFGGDEMKGIENLDGLMESLGGDTAAAGEAMGAMAEGMGAAASEAAMVIMIIEAVVKAVNDLITSTQSLIDQLNETRSEDNKIGDWFKYVSDFNKYAVKGWNDLKSGNGFAVLADIAGSIISIFNNVQRDKVKKYDKEIENQQKIVKNLEREYNRLEKAMKDSFGTDYIKNYNTALEKLTATAAAYQLMADNERAKGKSADEDKAQSYEDMKYQIEEQIRDMQDELANFFSGTDVTSAAKSFAEAWVEAYKSFGNTTGAIKEKFKEMIDNMVINSLAAAIVQKQLKPIFDMIDNLSKEGEELSERDIAAIAAETEKKTELINAELTALMQNLAAAGVNMRGTGNSLTGIAKDISGASEQSVNGLAAGINTQNFYMSYMPTISANVEAILAALTGEAAGTAARRAAAASTQSESVGSTFGDETFREQMKRMDQNIADLCYLIRSVRTGRGTNTNTHYIATK